jgi:hypothetical protein
VKEVKMIRRAAAVAVLMLAVAASLALAQVAPGPMPDPVAAGSAAILALGSIATAFVVWGVKLLLSKIPANVVLFAVPVLGIGVNYGVAWLVGHPPADPLLAALASTAATWLREVATTLPKGLSPVTPTKGML